MFNENAPEGATAAPNPTHDESGALVEAFKMGMMMANHGSKPAKAPATPEPVQPKYPSVTDNGAQAASKRQRTEIPNFI